MSLNKTTYLNNASGNLIRLYDNLTQYALNDIVERILKNEVITATTDYNAWRLQQMGLHLDKIKAYISKMTGKSNEEIERIFKDYGLKYYKSVRQISVDYGQNVPLTLETSRRMSDIFSYYVTSTQGHVKNLTATTAVSSQTLLINKLDQVHFRVTTGVQSYSQAVAEAIDEIGRVQLQVLYPSGTRHTIETAVRRAVVTGVNKCFADINLIRAKEDGYDHVLVSSHLGARHIENANPEYLSHDRWQGKIFSLNYTKIPIMNVRSAI